MSWARILILCALAIASLQFVGLAFNINFLKHPIPDSGSMNRVSAMGIMMSSLAFLLRIPKNDSRFKLVLSNGLVILVLLTSIWRNLSYLLRDRVYLPVGLDHDSISISTAMCGGLGAIVILLVNGKSNLKITLSHYLAGVIFLFAIFSTFINSYHAQSFYGIFAVPMTIYSAVCFLLISTATIFANPDKGLMKELTTSYAGSIMARRLVPVAILIPYLFGFLRLYGEWSGYYNTSFGTALAVLATSITCIVFVMYNAVLLNKRDIKMLKLTQELEQKIVERTEELNKLTVELRQLLEHIQTSREEERKYVAREIHDELGSALTALKIDVSMMQRKVVSGGSHDEDYLKNELSSVISQLNKSIDSVKKISTELRPEILDHLGVVEAVKWRVQQFENMTGIRCKFVYLPEMMNLEKEQSTTVYRIVQEALTNIARHAHASSVDIQIEMNHKNIFIKITDNGKGIREEELKSAKSFGLIGMRERIRLLDGNLSITGSNGKGTTVTATIPI